MKTVNARPLHPLTMFGLLALVIANVASYIIQRHTSLSEHVADPLMGFLHGVAIGALLLGIWLQSRALRSR
jgi:zinc transporter ZupT